MYIFADFNIVALVLNILMLVILLIPVIVGFRNGFVKTAFRFGKLAVCIGLAFSFCKKLGLFLKERFLYSFLREKISKLVYDSIGTAADATVDNLQNSVPEAVRVFLSAFGVDTGAMADSAVSAGGDVIENMINSISGALSGAVAVVLGFLAIFLVSLVVVGIVGALLNRIVTNLPVLKQLNSLLGGVCGLLIGIIAAWIAAQGIVALLGVIGGFDYSQAKILVFFHEGSPFRFIIKAILQGADSILASVTANVAGA